MHTDGGFQLLAGWSNEDDTDFTAAVGNPATNLESESTLANFSNVPEGSQFKYNDGTKDVVLTVTNSSNGVDVPVQYLNTLSFKAVAEFSGTLNIKVQGKTKDFDEDDISNTHEATSGEARLTLTVAPVADTATLAIKQASGLEDAGRLTGNTGNDAGASSINDAANGIELEDYSYLR